MSLADYLGPIIGFTLVGLAILIITICWTVFYLIPKAKDLAVHARLDAQTIDYNQKARSLVSELVCDETSIPPHIMDKVWELQGLNTGRKEIPQ